MESHEQSFKDEPQNSSEEFSEPDQEDRHKVEELSQLSSDLQNLLAATDIATLFLDRQLRILGFTPRVGELFDIQYSARGHPLADLTHRLGYDALQEDAQRVLNKRAPIEREIESEDGNWYLTRVLPYRTTEDRIEGIVITFVDITQRKEMEEDLREAKTYAESIIETLHEPLLVLTPDLHVKSANPAFYKHFAVHQTETEGRLIYELGNNQWDIPELRTLLEDVLPENNVFNDFEVEHDFDDIGRRVMLLNACRLDHVQLILLGIRDITERKRAEETMRASEERFRALVNARSYVVYRMSPDWSQMREFNGQGFLPDTKRPSETWLGDYVHPDDHPQVTAAIEEAIRTKSMFELEHRVRRTDGTLAWMHSRAVPLLDDDGEIVEWFGAASDVTARKKAEEAVRKNRERLERMVNIEGVGVMIFDEAGTLVDTNDAFLSMSGYSREEVEAKTLTWHAMTPPEYADVSKQQMQKLEKTGRIGPYEKEYLCKDGSRAWMLFAGASLGDGTTVEYCIDVSNRKQAEQALRESEERYRILFESIDEGFCIVEMLFDEVPVDYRFLKTNPAFERKTGLQGAEGKRMRELEPRHEEHWYQTYGRVARTGEPERFTNEAKHLGERWYNVYAFRIGAPEERKVAILFSDITEQKQAEGALKELNDTLEKRIEERTRQVQSLASTLTMAEQEERRRIAQILHDDLQQRLYGVQLKLNLIYQDVDAGNREALRANLEEAEAWLESSINVTRKLTVDLSPPILKNEGLTDALGWLVTQMETMHGLKVDLEADHAFVIADEDMRVLLFQIVRELLFNVVKHAGVQQATVALRELNDHLVIRVIDSGRGFDVEAAASKADQHEGLGLFSIRERLRLFGGRMEITSQPGEGTQVTIHAPAV